MIRRERQWWVVDEGVVAAVSISCASRMSAADATPYADGKDSEAEARDKYRAAVIYRDM